MTVGEQEEDRRAQEEQARERGSCGKPTSRRRRSAILPESAAPLWSHLLKLVSAFFVLCCAASNAEGGLLGNQLRGLPPKVNNYRGRPDAGTDGF